MRISATPMRKYAYQGGTFILYRYELFLSVFVKIHPEAPPHPPILLIIFLFASLILDTSMELRYTCVVRMELCPIPSLMTAMGMFISLATLAQVWRATYLLQCTVYIDLHTLVLLVFRAVLLPYYGEQIRTVVC